MNSEAYELGRVVGQLACYLVLAAVLISVVVALMRRNSSTPGAGGTVFMPIDEPSARASALMWYQAQYRPATQPMIRVLQNPYENPYGHWVFELWTASIPGSIRVAVDAARQIFVIP